MGDSNMGDAFVYVSIWMSMLAWFLGALSRARSTVLLNRLASGDGDGVEPSRHEQIEFLEILYRRIWLVGACLMIVHILAAYGVVHGWSHQAALEATAQESEVVTGIRAPWGVYVNLLFASLWLCYSLAMEVTGRRVRILDSVVFWFLAIVVFSATVVFERGAIRAASLVGFALLAMVTLSSRIGPDRRPVEHPN